MNMQGSQVVSRPVNLKPEWERLFEDVLPASGRQELSNRLDLPLLNDILSLRCTGLCGDTEKLQTYLSQYGDMPDVVCQHLVDKAEPGLLLWLPQVHAASENHPHPSVLQAWLLIWPQPNSFSQPSRQAPYCSCLRYAFEACGDLVCLMDAATFDPALYPFARKHRREIREFTLHQHMAQEMVRKGSNLHSIHLLLWLPV